jgi:hypothetical protein
VTPPPLLFEDELQPRRPQLRIWQESVTPPCLNFDDKFPPTSQLGKRGGAQHRQKDTIILDSNPFPEYCGCVQKMTTENRGQKGLQQTLEERGFDIKKLQAKCSPICPFENENCCMAHLISKQEDFTNQISLLETMIWEAGHECIFLPKFHCELNPIEMVSSLMLYVIIFLLIYFLSTVVLGMG